MSSERLRGQRDELTSQTQSLLTSTVSQRRRKVYDARESEELPGRLVRSEGQPAIGDAAADEAFDGAGATYDLFQEVYGRNSLDDRGLRMDSTVHYGDSFDNAFWNGRQMVYGDGDENLPEAERMFNRFTCSVDIIGHELTHGITQFEANLMYVHQPGALNESLSDVFGSLVKQRSLKQKSSEADWLIGGELFTDRVKAQAIRSMKAPGTAYDDPAMGKDPQPAHMKDYQELKLWQDSGGVHINSGIPNRAFYVTAIECGGYAWERAGLIWYVVLRDRLRRLSNFQDMAYKTYSVAGELFGPGSTEQKAVQEGWREVGLNATKHGILDLVKLRG